MGLLGEVFSAGDRMKRKLRGLLDDPMGTIALGSQRMSEDVQQMGLLADEAGYLPGTNSVLLTPQQKARARKELADKGAEMALAAATVWHGSPHKFDKFDSSKIGTGEGAQAYGHGLYLAENPSIARDYRNKLSQNVTTADASFGDKSLYEAADSFGETGYPLAFANKYFELLRAGKTEAQAKGQLLRQLEKRVAAAKFPGDVKGAKEAIDFLNSGAAELAGSLYKVDLPDQHIAKMLNWDKGGEDLWRSAVAEHGGAKEAANALRQHGTPGIRYLDGGSRGAGQGSSNFVVFPGNEGLLSILERNGAPIK